MSWPNIDPTSPASSDKVKFGDDAIRAFKTNNITALQAICNFQNNAGTVAALRTAVWTTATRPTGGDLVDRVTGYNTDLNCEEYYDLASTSWKQKIPNSTLATWSVSSRPSSPYTGQHGFNTDLAVIEYYSGTAWTRVSGGRRGDIKMWSGAVNDIETGWVLADGVARTHPEGGSYTPPDLRDKFITGAGTSYAVGATGGEATHILTTNEMPSHYHNVFHAYLTHNGSQYFGTSDIASSNEWTSHTESAGGGAAHNNLPPYFALCYLYKL